MIPDRLRLKAHLLPPILFMGVFITVFTLYILTLAPGVVGGDAGEHQIAVPLLGIPHTTGYPLYILVGKLWTLLLPFGSMAWRVNLFSALGGALAAGVASLIVYWLSQEILPTAVWAGAVVAGLALAFGLTFWQWSVIAGVRSFNIFFFALLTLQAITLAQYYKSNRLASADRILSWLAFTVGLSLAHHRTTLLYLPSLVAWIAWHDPALMRQPRRLFRLILLTLAPLTLYLFIYLRGVNYPPYTHEQITDFQSFWFLIGSGDSTGLFFSIDPAYLPARLLFIWRDLLDQLSLPGVALAMVGAAILLKRYPGQFLFQGLLMVLLLLFTLDFEVVNLDEAPTWYLMPAYFIVTVWLGLGVNGLISLAGYVYTLTRRTINPVEKPLTASNSARLKSNDAYSSIAADPIPFMLQLIALFSFTTLLILSLGRPNWQKQLTAAITPLDDWRQLLRGTQAQRFVESSLPYVEPNSIIWGDWEQYTPFKYYQLVLGQRPDVTVRNPLDRWPEKVAQARAQARPIYFTRKPADLIGTPHLSMVGPLIQLNETPIFTPPADIRPLNANFENELDLIGYRAQILPQLTPGGRQAGPILQLMLYWRAPQKLNWDYALSLRLIDRNGQEIYKKDAAHPVLSSYPTSLWTPGEIVGDYYELPLSPDAGPLNLHILPYRSEGSGVWHNLTLTNTEPPQEGLFLGPFSALDGL
ncbi:MAG: DUF2723 domain-containing protein [Anaerolineales bacterium]|nr:DUF2723 domain-containing protein [Anaerolineales bacterium]